MDNIKCTIGYERREGRFLQVELLNRDLNPQQLVEGLQSGKYLLMGNAIIESSEAHDSVATINQDSDGAHGEPENFNLETEHCDTCGMEFEKQSIDGGRCIECGALILPTYAADYSGPCPDEACSGSCVSGECSHCDCIWQSKVEMR